MLDLQTLQIGKYLIIMLKMLFVIFIIGKSES